MEPIMIMYAGYEGYKMVKDFVLEAEEFTGGVKKVAENVQEGVEAVEKTITSGEKIWQKIQYYYKAESTGVNDYKSLEELCGKAAQTYKTKHEKAFRLLKNTIYQTNVGEIMEDLEDLRKNNGILFYREDLLASLPLYKTMREYKSDFNILEVDHNKIMKIEERSEESANTLKDKVFIPLQTDEKTKDGIPSFLLMPKIHFATLMAQGKIRDDYNQMSENYVKMSPEINNHSIVGPIIRYGSLEDYNKDTFDRKIELAKQEKEAEKELTNLFKIHSHYTLNASSRLTGVDFCREEGKQHLVAYLTQTSPSEAKKDRIAVVDSEQNFKSVIKFDTKFFDDAQLSNVLSLYFAKANEIIACDDSGMIHLVDPTRQTEQKRVDQLNLGYIPATASYINNSMYTIKIDGNEGKHSITSVSITNDKKLARKDVDIDFKIAFAAHEYSGYQKMSLLERNGAAYILAQTGSNHGRANRLHMYKIGEKECTLSQNVSESLRENKTLPGTTKGKYESIMEVSYQGDYILLNNKGSVLDFYKWDNNNQLNFVGSKKKDAVFAGLISDKAFYSVNSKGILEVSPIYADEFKPEKMAGKYQKSKVVNCKFVKSNENKAGSYILVAYENGNNEVFYVK